MPAADRGKRPRPLVIAHRGASHDEPENSLAAFRRAVALGADGIELDVHATADGDLVVIHDDRIPGGRLPELPLAAVREHRLPNGERVPTLAESLEAIGPETDLFVELKSLPASADRHLFAALDGAPAPSRCHVHAFDHRIILRLRRQRPPLVGGVLSTSYLIHPTRQMSDALAAELWQQEAFIDDDLLTAVHGAGGKVYGWTVDEPDRMAALRALGVDGICTNRPDRARAVLS